MSKSIVLSGFARTEYKGDGHTHYYLEQPDGYQIDLVNRVAEIADNMGGRMAVSWWSSDVRKTKDEMIEGHLARVYGDVDSRYWEEEYRYSSYTHGSYDRETCEVGGHSLLTDFQDGRYMVYEFTQAPASQTQHFH